MTDKELVKIAFAVEIIAFETGESEADVIFALQGSGNPVLSDSSSDEILKLINGETNVLLC